MGEAKRRKQQDKNFGQPYFYIGEAPYTKKFLVYLKWKNEIVRVSPHYKLEDAQQALSQCEECLKTFWEIVFLEPPIKWKSAFDQRLLNEFNYEDDDEVIGVLKPSDEGYLVDTSIQTREQVMAEANIASLKAKGKRLFTTTPSG